VAEAVAGLAGLAAGDGQWALAARLFGAVEGLRRTRGVRSSAPEMVRNAAHLEVLRHQLGAEAFAAAFSAGETMPLARAVEEAMAFALSPTAGEIPVATTAGHGLSPRELEVLRLLAEGLADREIGERLFISHRTVMVHVSNLLAKLEVPSRTAAVNYALRHGLLAP
jgi:DNA-binding NarL/FixJ family response regulator